MFDHVLVFHNGIELKFHSTPDVNTINYPFFELYESGQQVTTPFKEIDIARHYNSLTLTLTLYFDFTLSENVKYELVVPHGNLLGLGGDALGVETFSTSFAVVTSNSFDASQIETVLGEPPPETYPDIDYKLEPIQIVDYSIRHDVFSGTGQLVSPDQQDVFRVVASTPSDDEIYVPQDFNLGRINLWFSKRPDSDFINTAVFRAQRKKIGVGHRWEDIQGVRVELHNTHPLVTFKFPALKQTELYETEGHDYFEKGYKYRVKVSGYLPAES